MGITGSSFQPYTDFHFLLRILSNNPKQVNWKETIIIS